MLVVTIAAPGVRIKVVVGHAPIADADKDEKQLSGRRLLRNLQRSATPCCLLTLMPVRMSSEVTFSAPAPRRRRGSMKLWEEKIGGPSFGASATAD